MVVEKKGRTTSGCQAKGSVAISGAKVRVMFTKPPKIPKKGKMLEIPKSAVSKKYIIILKEQKFCICSRSQVYIYIYVNTGTYP